MPREVLWRVDRWSSMHKNNSTSSAKLHQLIRADYNNLKKVLTILKSKRDDPRARQRYSALFRCVWYKRYNVIHFFTKSKRVKTGLLRCQLRQRCPRCMSAKLILARRQDDFKLLEQTAELVSGSRYGKNAACWLIENKSETRLSPKKFAKGLGPEG